MRISEKSYDENGNKFDAPKGSREDILWNKKASASHRKAVLKDILEARARGHKDDAIKIAEDFHTKPKEQGTISHIAALRFSKGK